MVGVWQQDRWSNGGSRGNVAGVTTNGGATWTIVNALKTSLCTGGTAANGGDYQRATDPWVTFGPGPNPIAYQLSLSFNDLEPPITTFDFDHALLASRSTDGGLTWSSPIRVIRDTAPTVFNDKQSITADPTNASYVYAVWDRLVFPGSERASVVASFRTSSFSGPAWFARSSNAGVTWEPARQIFDPGQRDQTIGNQIVVQPNGDLIDIFTEFNNENAKKHRGGFVRVLRSTDKGDTWSGPFDVGRLGAIGAVDPETGDPVRDGAIIPDIAVDSASGAALRGLAGRELQRRTGGRDRVLPVARRRSHVVAADQGQQDADRDPDREPAGVHGVRRRVGRRHRRGHVLRLPQQHVRYATADGLLRRPLSSDVADGVPEPGELGATSEALTDDVLRHAPGAVRGRVLHGRLRGTGERRERLHALLLAAARDRSVQRVLPARWLRATDPARR